MIGQRSLLYSLMVLVPACAAAQAPSDRPPVIDLHMHAPLAPGPLDSLDAFLEHQLASIDSFNVRYVMLTGVPDVLFAWSPEFEERTGVLPGLLFPCENGVAVHAGRPCFDHGGDWPEVDRLREDIEAGRVGALGEITTQFLGLSPSGPELEPYFGLAEEYDLPMFIHLGPGFPGAAYEEGLPVPPRNYRAAAGDPLLLEEALLRHPTVRVVVMHAGWPLADQMVSTLYHHPQLRVGVGWLQNEAAFPREEYYAFLQRLVRAGFADRILFGSDASLAEGIDAILEADFLTEQQKRDILCANAARFLRLDEATCK
ncbi:MAG: amidohydrolase family protein [Longimicrobiales bacterium]|nr:amidohydrolase family protein [Longimicrobiales bacterium]